MIFQGTTSNNSEAIAEALTKAEIERQKLLAALDEAEETLKDADNALHELGAEWEDE